MKKSFLEAASLVALLAVLGAEPNHERTEAKGFPRFRSQEIARDLKVGYAVLLADINGDGKKDIVVVDSQRVIWYENPTWKMRGIIQGQTKPDNVCIAAYDIDGDGRLDLALGADWKPFNTKEGGTLQWLRRGKTLDDPWTLYPIDTVPTVHRIRFADVYGNGKPALIVAPLMGRNSTQKNNWMDGEPVHILAYKIPKNPVRDRWAPEVLDQSLHVVHNVWPVRGFHKADDVLLASYEGVSLLTRNSKFRLHHIVEGNQDNPKSSRGASEVREGKLKNGREFIATIEPWHGHQVVVYTPANEPSGRWKRHVIDDKLRWGHAIWCADLDGNGDDELIIGVRDNLSDKSGERRGVRIYKALDGTAEKWQRHIIEEGGVAVEDLAAADLDGDGGIDIVAAGRQTGNVRIYWNEGLKNSKNE